uniref:Uncharacterized protein n=1 Tax=Dunaliella viridis TaxID=140095 RepID=D2SPE0_9CHLO|nr:hypothetical protein [Dunaliella viridis]
MAPVLQAAEEAGGESVLMLGIWLQALSDRGLS